MKRSTGGNTTENMRESYIFSKLVMDLNIHVIYVAEMICDSRISLSPLNLAPISEQFRNLCLHVALHLTSDN